MRGRSLASASIGRCQSARSSATSYRGGAKLVIEVDGGQHDARSEDDARRTRYLEAQGFRVIRFWNNEVLDGLEGVIAAIERTLADSPSPDPSRTREGR